MPTANAAAIEQTRERAGEGPRHEGEVIAVGHTATRLQAIDNTSVPPRTLRLFNLIVNAVRTGPPIARPSA